MNGQRIQGIARKSALVLAALFLIAGIAAAQPAYRGSFTLNSQVHWGKATLAPGHYTFTLNTVGDPYIITVHRGDDRAIFVMPLGTSTNVVHGQSALLLTDSGNDRAVRALRLAELNLTLSFNVPQREREEEARKGKQNLKEVAVKAEK